MEKSIKVSGDNCFPRRSLVSFLHYLSCFAFVFVYALEPLCSSPFPPPSAPFPVSDPLSYHRTTSYTYSSPERPIDLFLPLTASPTL